MDNKLRTERLKIGRDILKLVVSIGEQNPAYLMMILEPSIDHVERHCAKPVMELMMTRDKSETEIKETHDQIKQNLCELPKGEELAQILTLEHLRLMLRFMVYAKRELGDEHDAIL